MDEPRSAWSRRRSGASAENVEFTGLAQILGQPQASVEDFQLKYWTNLQNLG
jgi:hypothetical protein